MEKEKKWEAANLVCFNSNNDSPFLHKELSLPNIKTTYERDFQKGYDDGLVNAATEMRGMKDAFLSMINSLLNPLKEADNKFIEEVAELALCIAKQIIRRELQIDSGQVVAIVKEAIRVLPLDQKRIIIHLNPRDIGIIRKVFHEDELTTNYVFIEDPSIDVGGCKLATEYSIVDATVQSQIASVAARILGSQRKS